VAFLSIASPFRNACEWDGTLNYQADGSSARQYTCYLVADIEWFHSGVP
jgi:hypothetical protein